MSIRIYIYVVEPDGFEQSLGRTISDFAEHYLENAPEAIGLRSSWILPLDAFPFVNAVPGRGLVGPAGRQGLDRSLREALDGDSLRLHGYLRALCQCRVSYVRSVTSGHRRGWIGSFLGGASRCRAVTRDQFERAVECFAKMVRGYNTGSRLLKSRDPAASRPRPDALPGLTLGEDPDWLVGVWSADDAVFLADFMAIVAANTRSFGATWESSGPSPDTDEGWDEWVRTQVSCFEDGLPPLAESTMISFIG